MRMHWLAPAMAAVASLVVAWTALAASVEREARPDLPQPEHETARLPTWPRPAPGDVQFPLQPPIPIVPEPDDPDDLPADIPPSEPNSEPATVRVSFRHAHVGMAVCGDAIVDGLRRVGTVSAIAENETTKVVSLLVAVADPVVGFLDGPLIVQTGSGKQVRYARILKRYYAGEDPAKPIEELGCTADSDGNEPPILKGNEVFAQIGPWHGSYIAWFPDGSRACEGRCEHGMRTGEWTFWYPGGVICCKGEFSMGRPCGTWNYWHPNGSVRAETRHVTNVLGLRMHQTDYVVEAKDADGTLLPPFQLDYYLSKAMTARGDGLAVDAIMAEAECWFDSLADAQWRLNLEPVLTDFRIVAEQAKQLPDAEAAEALSNARDRVIYWRNSCFPQVPGMNWGNSMPLPAEPATLDEVDTHHTPALPRSTDPQTP